MTFKNYSSIEDVLTAIHTHDLTFLYMVTTGCSVCHGLQPQVEKIFEQFPEVHTMVVNSTEVPEVASEFQLLTAPGLLLFVEGKEYLRKARMINTQGFEASVGKIVTGYLSTKD